MKTAMQELIELIENGETELYLIENHKQIWLEKEKEQIKDAHCWGWSDAYDNLQHNKSRLCEEYYNQTYNQKQHIIDIMKADEDDGLYNQNK